MQDIFTFFFLLHLCESAHSLRSKQTGLSSWVKEIIPEMFYLLEEKGFSQNFSKLFFHTVYLFQLLCRVVQQMFIPFQLKSKTSVINHLSGVFIPVSHFSCFCRLNLSLCSYHHEERTVELNNPDLHVVCVSSGSTHKCPCLLNWGKIFCVNFKRECPIEIFE